MIRACGTSVMEIGQNNKIQVYILAPAEVGIQ